MDPRLLDVLHHRADERVATIRDRVDVDLNRTLDKTVDENRAVDDAEVVRRIADAHRAAAEDVGRPDQNRKADALCDRAGL